MAKSRVINGDAGKELLKQINKAKKLEVAVGLPQSKGFKPYPEGLTTLDVGLAHEFGNPAIGLPQRSFLRAPFLIKDKEITKTIDVQLAKVLNGKETAFNALSKIGIKAVGISQGAFTSRGYGTWADITQETKDKKGSSQVLIDSGILRGSILHVVRNKGSK